MRQFTEKEAIEFSKSGVWKKWNSQKLVRFQLFQDRLCIPINTYGPALNKVFGRSVFSHEIASANFGKNMDRKLVDMNTASKTAITIISQVSVVAIRRFEKLRQQMPTIEKGTQIHIVSFLEQNLFSKIYEIIVHQMKVAEEVFISTWTLDNADTKLLFTLFDLGHIKKIAFLSGVNFKNKRTDRYAMLLNGMDKRGQQMVSFKNHSKVTILKGAGFHLTIESSANLSGHQASEQFVITESKELFDYHQKWMNKILTKNG